MKLTRCEKGHFYDTDKYAICPHCSGEALKDDRCPDRDAADSIWEDDGVVYVDKPIVDGDDWRERIGIESPVILNEDGELGVDADKKRYRRSDRQEDVPVRLKIVRCENGHLYNGAKYDVCPLCSELRQGGSSVPDAHLKEKPLEPKFAQCKNGHTYNRELYARCPVCEKDEQEKKEKREAGKEQPKIKVSSCGKGHFYDGAKYDSCPYCSGLLFSPSDTEFSQCRFDIVMCENGHTYSTGLYSRCPECEGAEREKRKKQETVKDWLCATVTYCENGHFYDGNKYADCPHCGSAAQDDDDKKTIL